MRHLSLAFRKREQLFVARRLRCLHCRLTARRSWVRFLHGALLALGGQVLPRPSVTFKIMWAISRAFLCSCSPCVHKGFPPLRTPTEKHAKRTEHMSIPDQRWTVHLTWSPGAYKLPTAPGGSWRRDSPGWEKAEDKFTATSSLRVRVCVCPVSPPYIHVCVPVCRVCQ